MTPDILLAFSGFALIGLITPGPNNLMLMASGTNFGFARTLPHLFGVAFGFCLMVLLVGLGLAQIFTAFPAAHRVLQGVCVLYLAYLAWKIATAAAPEKGEAGGTPLSFLQAALFQWVNPKSWTMALTAVTAYVPAQASGLAIALIAGLFGLIAMPSASLWTLMGTQLRRFLRTPRNLRLFNMSAAGLLMLSLYPVFFGAGV